VVITGALAELHSAVKEHLTRAIVKGAVWARFGALIVETAPRRRAAGLVAVGIDRLVLPMEKISRMEDVVPTAATANRTFRGWLSYNE
jgi:hypothetical protein